MSVLIKGMDMPRNCKECDYLYGSLREGYRCERLEKWLDVAVDAKRDPDCLVVAVPTPHGNLIDRDHAIQLFENTFCDFCQYEKNSEGCKGCALLIIFNTIKMVPTIIEKEE